MKANQKFKEDKKGFANLVPMVLAVVIVFAILFVGTYVVGQIGLSLEGTYGTLSSAEQKSWSTMNNSSADFDSTIDIVQVVIIITVLASAIGAIFMFTRFR